MPSKDYTQTLCKIILFRHQSFKPSIHSKDELACSRPFLQHLIQSLMLHIFLHIYPAGKLCCSAVYHFSCKTSGTSDSFDCLRLISLSICNGSSLHRTNISLRDNSDVDIIPYTYNIFSKIFLSVSALYIFITMNIMCN